MQDIHLVEDRLKQWSNTRSSSNINVTNFEESSSGRESCEQGAGFAAGSGRTWKIIGS